MFSKRFFMRVSALLVVVVTAPLAFPKPAGGDRTLGLGEDDPPCAQVGTCCFRPGSICMGRAPGPEDDLLDHYYEPSGECPPPARSSER